MALFVTKKTFLVLRRIGLALIMCASLTACGSLTTTDLNADDLVAAHQLPVRDLKTEVDSLVAPLAETKHTPGVVAGVLLPDGTMHFYGYGVANRENGRAPNGDTLFAVGSLSKGFLGAETALLVDKGVLSWNDTLPELLPPNTPLSSDAQKITLLQLTTHTSGLPRQPLTLETLSYFVRYLFTGESFYNHFDRDYVFNYLADFEADNTGKSQYSNIGYGLLGYILERRTGKTVDQLLAQKIVRPLKLKCTGYTQEELPCYPERAHGYAGDQPKFIPRGEPTPDWHFTHLMRGSAALYSNAKDLLTFAAAHVKGHKSRLNAVMANDLKVRVPQDKASAAIAWVVDDVDGQPIDYQIGIVAGFTSYIGIDPEHKTAVVILQNSFNWDSSVGHKLLLRLRNWQTVKNR